MSTQVDEEAAPLLFVVACDRPDFWDYLCRWFSGLEHVQVVLDRRGGNQRRVRFDGVEQRGTERRHQPTLDDEIRTSGFAIIRRLEP